MRLRYTSFINYALNITSAVFSIFFLVIVTRRLSVEDYATWVMIWHYVGYFLIPTVVFSTWATRDISRGKNTSITSVMTSIFFGITSIPFYLLVMFFLSSSLEQPLVPLLISSVALFLDYLSCGLYSVAYGHAPQIVGYAGFTYKVVSLIFGLIFVGSLAYGLTGAVVASLFGRMAMDTVSIYMNRSLLGKSSFQITQMVAWIRSSWLPIFGSIAGLLVTFDVLVVSFIYPTPVPVAYYGICVSIASFATFASAVSSSLYPKILCNRNIDDLKEAIWLLSLLSLPVIFLMIIYAEPLCAILNITYLNAVTASRIMIFGIYFSLLSGMASTVYYGLDPFDEKKLESKALLSSSIFKGYQVSFVLGIAYLLILSCLSSLPFDSFFLVVLWVAALTSIYIISFVAFVRLIRRRFGMVFPIYSVLRDLVIFAVPAIASIIPSLLIPVAINESFYLTLYSLIPPALLSLAIYFGVLYALERRFRATVRDIVRNNLPMIRRQRK